MNIPNRPTAYERMCEHHRTHQFKKGANAGDAPLDTAHRYGHKRIRIYPTHADVILHRSTVFRAYPDGTIELTTDGYRSNTTKDTINACLRRFARVGAFVYSARRFGLCQWHYGSHPFYDGMRLHPDGAPADPKPFKRKTLDRSQSKPFTAASRPFKQTFPILHAALPDTTSANTPRARAFYDNQLHNPGELASAITSTPELWPAIVEYYAYENHRWATMRKRDAADALRAVMQAAKEHMYVVIDHTVTQV